MPKNIEDMIVPERRKSIRDIPIPEGRRKNNEHPISLVPKERFGLLPETNPRRRKSIWVAAGAGILILMFAILSVFNGATVSYVPKSAVLSFEGNSYTAKKIGEGLLFSVIKLSNEKGLEVAASGEEKVERKASGSIIVYNTTAKVQRFRATTRFEAPGGKIYQVQDNIIVPAKGSLEVTVYAERPGEEFNIDLADFSLPGLKGTSLSSSVYARSKTKMTGGFVGVEGKVSDEDKKRAGSELESALKDELIAEARAQAPEDFVLLPSLSSFSFEDLPQTSASVGDEVTINMRGNLEGIMFKKGDLATYLAKDKINLASGELIDIVGLDTLSFSFIIGNVPAYLSLSNEIKFTVTGKAQALWQIDETALKADLAGKSKKDLSSVLKNYPAIVSATATVRPFWKSSFPANGKGITLKKLPVK